MYGAFVPNHSSTVYAACIAVDIAHQHMTHKRWPAIANKLHSAHSSCPYSYIPRASSCITKKREPRAPNGALYISWNRLFQKDPTASKTRIRHPYGGVHALCCNYRFSAILFGASCELMLNARHIGQAIVAKLKFGVAKILGHKRAKARSHLCYKSNHSAHYCNSNSSSGASSEHTARCRTLSK